MNITRLLIRRFWENIYCLLFLFIGLCVFSPAPVSASVISFRDTTALVNSDISIPIYTSDLTGLGAMSYDGVITYNPQMLEYNSFSKTNTLSAPFTVVINSNAPGILVLSAAHFQAVSGGGVLLILNFKTKAVTGVAALKIESCAFSDNVSANERYPVRKDGIVFIMQNSPSSNPDAFAYPNPFRKFVNIVCFLPERNDVQLTIHSIDGREIRTIQKPMESSGFCMIIWDGTLDSGMLAASGIYFCEISSGSFRKTIRITHLK